MSLHLLFQVDRLWWGNARSFGRKPTDDGIEWGRDLFDIVLDDEQSQSDVRQQDHAFEKSGPNPWCLTWKLRPLRDD